MYKFLPIFSGNWTFVMCWQIILRLGSKAVYLGKAFIEYNIHLFLYKNQAYKHIEVENVKKLNIF